MHYDIYLYNLLGLLMLELNVQEVVPWKFFRGKQVPNLCEHNLTKANLWKIQKPRCENILFRNVSLFV